MSSILDYVVPGLIESLARLLRDEAKFLAGVEDRVNSFIGDLDFINSFLKKSEGKRNDEIVTVVVRQIRKVANEAEDVIDDYLLKVVEHRRKRVIGRILHAPSHAMMLRNVGSKIVDIKERIEEIYNNKERYGIERDEAPINAFEDEAMHRLRREVEEDDVVGFVHDSTTLVNQLTKGDPKLDVISIIGMGGLGKTTLARKIYNILRVKGHFDSYVWVSVSQDFRIMELLLEILKQLTIKLEDKSVDALKKKLLEHLKEKRYLIVMDDIWRTEVWDEVKSVFPNCFNRSRILITSRNREVALLASNTPPHLLPFLNQDDSWELFKKKVFRNGVCPPELVIPGRQIAEGCKGLPLSIVVLAGLLAKKEKSFYIWYLGCCLNSRMRDSASLRILKLEHEYGKLSDESIHVIANSFPQLQFLKLHNLSIEIWEQEGGAMPSLKHLVISGCYCNTSLPELLRLTSLRSVEVISCPTLSRMLRKSQMEVGFNLLIKDCD